MTVNSQFIVRTCSLSVMDNIADPDIKFDSNGISNYYYQYKELEHQEVFSGSEGSEKLHDLLTRIKAGGRNKKYDCITGISGGIDSSYLIYLCQLWGLRPLIVHFDNGWNSETAVNNVRSIIKHTGFDLFTLVVDWEEFKDLQLSYLRASVVDIEVPTDHAISGTLQKIASDYGIRYILSGNNVATEAILPPSWIYSKSDYVNLLSIHKKYGKRPLKTYPVYGFKEQYFYGSYKGIHTVKPLNFMDYNKDEAKKIITEKLGWRDYGGKHYESLFTKFYQAYILPTKFKIDKRKAHFSNLIFSGQMKRDEAIALLQAPLYSMDELEYEKDYFLKKLGLSSSEFEKIMALPRCEHRIYGTQKNLFQMYPLLKTLRPLIRLAKKVTSHR